LLAAFVSEWVKKQRKKEVIQKVKKALNKINAIITQSIGGGIFEES
jgi:uncharacterized protein YqgC (DUF456 family)